jgi:hypothetical protein
MSIRSTLVVVMSALVATVGLAAQSVPAINLPASPRGLAAVQVGGRWVQGNGGPQYRDGKWISIDYGRPILRGRENIFGTGPDYGRAISDGAPVWRTGANATTRLTTQIGLQIGGATIQPGVYNVLVELKEGAWTLVLSTQPVQEQYDPSDMVNLYGSYNYDPSFDLLRAPMTIGTSPVSFEQFTIDFIDVSDTGGRILMVWDTTVATIPFAVQ